MATVLSDQDTTIFEIVNYVCICSVVGTCGIFANIVNMLVFHKQGFTNTVNIGLFGLALSDLICLIMLQWASINFNPLFTSSGIPWYPIEVMYVSAAWPHVCFSRITSFITVYITAERYLSIAFPLKVKEIITPKISAICVCLIYLVNLSTLFPEYATSYLDWRYVPSRNQTLIGLVYTNSRSSVQGVTYVLHSLLGMTSFAGVIVFTTLLVTKLKECSKWRKEATSSVNKLGDISNRDKKTVKMILLIASVLIGCYTPGAIIALATFIVGPECDIKGKYLNISDAMWSIAFSFQSINSSVNIFIYCSMSSKYRQTVQGIIFTRRVSTFK